MKKSVSTIVAVIISIISFGQTWTFSYKLPQDAEPVSISAVSPEIILVATTKGLFRTADAGKTWAFVSTGSTFSLVRCNSGICYNIAYASVIEKSLDSGKTWSALPTPSGQSFREVWPLTKDLLILDGQRNNDTMFISYNGGANWQEIQMPKAEILRYIVTDSLSFHMSSLGSNTFLQRTADQGKTVTNTQVPYDNNLNTLHTVSFLNPRVGYASIYKEDWSYKGHIYKTIDSGKSFSMLTTFSTNPSFPYVTKPIQFINERVGWIAYMNMNHGFYPYKTLDSGKTWMADTIGIGSLGFNHISNFKMISPTYGYGITKDFKDNKYVILKYGTHVPDSNIVRGRVYLDRNNNCQYDATVDVPLKNVIVRQKEDSFYGYTDADGNYEITPLLIGNHTLQVILPADVTDEYDITCLTNGERTISFTGSADILNGQDFAINALVIKHKPIIKVASSRFRRCARNTATISYKNAGLEPLTNAVVKLKMPEYVKLVGANKSYTVDAEGMYVFNVGTVPPFTEGTITIIDSIVCGDESIRNRVQCIEVFISADSVNYKTDTVAWDKSEVIVKARCMNGWINFQIINTTGFDMGDSAELRLFSNAQQADKRKYKLKAGDTLNFTIPANYTTYRMEADQRPGHPLSKYAQATIEGCEGEGAGTVSTGFVNVLPVNDFKFKKHVHCEPIRDSYDPNDKTVLPEGIGSNQYVKPGTQLTYRIRFQNTGTDTAFKVIVKDTLSSDLDLATFSMGTASHPYTHVIKGTGKPVLEVTFNNINLPDSTTNKTGSNGFFTYTISHKGTIAQGTAINNKADIYFDFNSAIRTNTATITIKDTLETHPTHPPVIPVDKLPFILKNYTKDTLCKGDTVTVVIIGEGPYLWTKQGSLVTIGTGHELQIIADTTTTYTGRTKDGSENITVLVKDCKVNPPDGVKEIAQSKILVYPNPSANGVFYVTSQNPGEIKRIKIITQQGKHVMSTTDNHTIDLSTQAPGIYFMVVETTGGNLFYQKLIKQ